MKLRVHRRLGVLQAPGLGVAAISIVAHLAMAESPPSGPAVPVATPAALSAAPTLAYSNKWRLQVSEGANNDGVMRFRVTPKDQTPIDIHVQIEDGRGEDGCARDIRDAFKAALDKKAYKVEMDDGEDVLVKLRSGPTFAIELVESTVKGTRINFDRE